MAIDTKTQPIVLKPGDVLRYHPSQYHCREGMAYVTDAGRIVDTFWRFNGDGESHTLTDDELATIRPYFNVGDFDALDLYSHQSRATWETYHPDDRARISSQHGLQEALFIRKGATPDITTQIKRAQEKVEDAESKLSSAKHNLEWARKDLAALEAQRTA